MSINSTNSTSNSIVDLANQLFKQVDADRDGKLNGTEFQSFLQNLLATVSGKTSGLGSESTSMPRTSVPVNGYQAMLGFNYDKLNDLTHTTPKYVFARATQNVADPGFTRALRSTALADIVADVQANGYPDARVTGDDTIDFGDGIGDVDVLTSDGRWWWSKD